MSINTKVCIIRIGKSKVHSAKEQGVLMYRKTIMSVVFVAAWHYKVIDKKAARHMQTVSLRKETSTPA